MSAASVDDDKVLASTDFMTCGLYVSYLLLLCNPGC